MSVEKEKEVVETINMMFFPQYKEYEVKRLTKVKECAKLGSQPTKYYECVDKMAAQHSQKQTKLKLQLDQAEQAYKKRLSACKSRQCEDEAVQKLGEWMSSIYEKFYS